MQKNQVAIIGYGYVGKAMQLIFPDAYIYDPTYTESKSKEQINTDCQLAIVCVPTPPLGTNGVQAVDQDEKNFLGVDTSIVEETISWLATKHIVIKSTVPPTTTDTLNKKYNKQICFSPEYIGEGGYVVPSHYPDPKDPRKHEFMIIGGAQSECEEILALFMPKLGPAKMYYILSAVEAECVKYMENTYGAMKVVFANEWYDMCQQFGASYEKVREGFLLDGRCEPSHTAVFKHSRGFGGKCYPKDLLGIINASETAGYNPEFLKQVWQVNKKMTAKNKST